MKLKTNKISFLSWVRSMTSGFHVPSNNSSQKEACFSVMGLKGISLHLLPPSDTERILSHLEEHLAVYILIFTALKYTL